MWTVFLQKVIKVFRFLLTQIIVLLGSITQDELRAPSGWAAAPGLLSECRGRSHRPPVVSLLLPNSPQSVEDRVFKLQE